MKRSNNDGAARKSIAGRRVNNVAAWRPGSRLAAFSVIPRDERCDLLHELPGLLPELLRDQFQRVQPLAFSFGFQQGTTLRGIGFVLRFRARICLRLTDGSFAM